MNLHGELIGSAGLLAVTAFPIRDTKSAASLCCHMQKVL